MKRKPRPYHRTAALLNAQPQMAASRYGQRPRVVVPWKSLMALTPLVVLGALLAWVWADARWYVSDATLQIAGTASQPMAREIALASNLVGKHSLWLQPQTAAAQIMQTVAGVTAAEVDCRLYPTGCTVTVTERRPVAAWQSESGLLWIDAEGLTFQPYAERPTLPVLRGELPVLTEGRIAPEVLEGARALQKLGLAWDALVYHADKGWVWNDTEGRQVAFGVGSQKMEGRLQMYHAIVAHLEARSVFPWLIDVRFPERPTYSLD